MGGGADSICHAGLLCKLRHSRRCGFFMGGGKTLAFSKGCDPCWWWGVAGELVVVPPAPPRDSLDGDVRRQDGRSQRRPWSRAASLMSAWGRTEAPTPTESMAAKAEEASHAKKVPKNKTGEPQVVYLEDLRRTPPPPPPPPQLPWRSINLAKGGLNPIIPHLTPGGL